MDKLGKIHRKSITLYLCFPCFAIILAMVCVVLFHVWLPFWLVGGLALSGTLVSAIIKLRFWFKRHEELDNTALESHQAHIIFGSIPAELAFWIIAMGFLLSGS